ncbi:MAG: lysine--tRNA ligase, partial [Brevundimonas sp.]
MLQNLEILARDAKSWPFEQARNLLAHVLKKRLKPEDLTAATRYFAEGRAEEAMRVFEGLERPVVFETGYGPSGLPHMGTFGEVARTTMVRNAFRALTGDHWPTRLVAFSDDMDGLRKVPEGIPNPEVLAEDLHKPLTVVRDPFGTHDSFGAHNNARLRAFIDSFGFDYEFLSSTEQYRSGRFDKTLLTLLERFDAVQAIMLPTLGPERRETY